MGGCGPLPVIGIAAGLSWGTTTASQGTTAGQAAVEGAPECKRIRKEMVREIIHIFYLWKRSFSNTPPCSFKPGDSPKHSSYLIPLRHFDTTI